MSMGVNLPPNARGPAEADPRYTASDDADLDGPHVHCLRPLVAGLGLVLHARALGERAVAVRFEAAVVDEEVLAAFIGCDEAEALLVAEPLNGALCHVFPPRRLACCVCRGSSKATVCERLHCFRRTLCPAQTSRTVPRFGDSVPACNLTVAGAETPLVRFGRWQNVTPPSSEP